MANVVKLKTPLQKWLRKKKLQTKPLNWVISKAATEQVALELDSFKKSVLTSKNLVLDFCLEKNDYAQAATNRSIRHYKASIVMETIILAIRFRESLAREACAIETIAQKIAANITSGDIVETTSRVKDIEASMSAAFSLRIMMPVSYLENILQTYQELVRILTPSTFLCSHNHDTGAQIWVCATDTSFYLDFDETDIDSIFAGVVLYLKSSGGCTA